MSGTGETNGWMISPDTTSAVKTSPVDLSVTTVITSNGEDNECYVY